MTAIKWQIFNICYRFFKLPGDTSDDIENSVQFWPKSGLKNLVTESVFGADLPLFFWRLGNICVTSFGDEVHQHNINYTKCLQNRLSSFQTLIFGSHYLP